MMLHHGATILLYGFSYYCNRVESGVIIMYLHDWADIPVALLRCFVETTFEKVVTFGAAFMILVWFHTRLFVFPQVIWATSVDVFDGNYPTF